MVYLLITAYLLLYAWLSWRKPVWSVALIAAFLPSYLIRFAIAGIPFTLLEAMIFLLFTVWAIRSIKNVKWTLRGLAKGETKIKNKGLVISIVLFLVASTVSVFVSPDIRASLGIWKAYFLEPILFFIVFASVVKTDDDRRLIISSLGFSALYISAIAIYQKFTGWEIPAPWAADATRRVTSVFGYPNAVGLYLAPLIVLGFGQFIQNLKPKIQNLVASGYWLVAMGTSTVAIIFSRTEGAWIAVAIGLIFLGLIMKRFRLITVITVIVITLIIGVSPIKNQLTKEAAFHAQSRSVRLQMWKETLSMLETRPIFGAGLAGYQTAVAPFHKENYIEIYLYPHNIVLNFWSETGLLGLIAFFLLVVLFFKQRFKILRFTQDDIFYTSLMAAMATLLIHGLVDVPYFKNDLSVMFWILMGLMFASISPLEQDPAARPH